MEPILDNLKRRLRDVGPSLWTPIAIACGVAKTLPRKIVYGDRENPGVLTIQPLVDFFDQLDRGVRAMPAAETPAHAVGATEAVEASDAG